MDKLERRKLYESMLVDWSKPIVVSTIGGLEKTYSTDNTHTLDGFCWYLIMKDTFDGKLYELLELTKQRKIKHGLWHYEQTGKYPEGRKQRVEALKKAIALTYPWYKRRAIRKKL